MYAIPFKRRFLTPSSVYLNSRKLKLQKWPLIILISASSIAAASSIYIIYVLFFFNITFVSTPIVLAQTNSPAIVQLMQSFTTEGINPTLGQAVSRKYLSGSGETISLDGDSFQVFQYSDTSTAEKEASLLAQRYADSTRSILWKNQIHIFASANMVIFYLGKNQGILGTLYQVAGLSEVNK